MGDDYAKFLEKPTEGGYQKHVERLRAEIHDLRREVARRTPKRQNVKPQTHLVIGDSHSDPDVPNDRYAWLGKLVAEIRPDVVVDIGDWADMGSLSSYDRGKKSFEGRRYWRDVDQSIKAREVFGRELKGLRKKPRLLACEGNHEHRITKATDENPALDGLISTADLKVTDHGWESSPFLVPVVVDGIGYCHYWGSGTMGRAIGGENIGTSLLRHCLSTVVQGHSHVFGYAERTRPTDGQKQFGMSVGAYFDHFMPWAGQANQLYWRGIVLIREVENGYGQVQKIGLDEIKRRFGK